MYRLLLKNDVKNELGKTLDLVLSDIDNLHVYEEHCPVVNVDKHHPPLAIVFDATGPVKNNTKVANNLYNFRKADFLQLYYCIQSLNWDEIINFTDVDSAVEYFYSKLYNAINQCVPLSSPRKSKYPPWFNHNIIVMIRRKEKLRKQYNKIKMHHLLSEYRVIRSRIKFEIKTAYNNYVQLIENKICTDPQSFWSIIKKLRNVNITPTVMTLDGEEAEGVRRLRTSFPHISALCMSLVTWTLANSAAARSKHRPWLTFLA